MSNSFGLSHPERFVTVTLAISLASPILATSRPAHAQAPAPGGDGTTHLDSALRFHNAPPATSAGKEPRVPRPVERAFMRDAYFFDAYVGKRAVRSLPPVAAGRARAVNALDEVPDSSWFENRIGVRPLAPDELVQRAEPPPRAPYVVVGSKVGGVSVGMRVRDASGAAFLLKFDDPGDPDTATACDVVVQRLLWAAGYLTPEDSIVNLRREDLRLDPRATAKDTLGVSHPMTEADLARMLAKVDRRPDGSYRGLMSRLLPGKAVGGYPQEGVRPDDPGDAIAHQDRRDQRGARVFFAWLNHTDVKEDNTVDTWIEDAATPGGGHMRHQLVDFGNSLGTFGWQVDQTAGFTQGMDFEHGARALVSFGLWRRPWEGVQQTHLRGVGVFESARFDPVEWRARYPWAPFERFDRFDGVWGARILMRITPAHIAAAVGEGHYADPHAAAYVTRTLVERQRKIARHYLGETSPLEGFSFDEHRGRPDDLAGAAGGTLCFDDPLLGHFGAQEPQLVATTRHRVVTWDFAGRPLPARAERAGAVRTCVDGITLAPDHDGYTIVDIETTRAGGPRNRLLLHIAREPASGHARVIGLRRL